jgi:hypothetical protein
MTIPVYARPYIIPCPPSSLLRALCYPATMYNQPASQRDFTSHTRSNSGQENQATEDLRNYAPIQEQFASSDASCARESNAHGRGALGLGSMGGRGEYNRERSGSLRQVGISKCSSERVREYSPLLSSPHPITPSTQTWMHITEGSQ